MFLVFNKEIVTFVHSILARNLFRVFDLYNFDFINIFCLITKFRLILQVRYQIYFGQNLKTVSVDKAVNNLNHEHGNAQ